MNPQISKAMRHRAGGQTIIVALIILGLLLILGFVFIGIINRNIQTAGTMQRRSAANDLSEAGIRYAHAQLLQSELGADWRPTPTQMPTYTLASDPGGEYTDDPDALYLRPAARQKLNGPIMDFRPGQRDQGGPDGLGPFTRINYDNGRALIRVRYAPSDVNLFAATPTGALRSPGLTRNYILIESIGRPGRVSVTDPTTLDGVVKKVQQWNGDVELQQFLGRQRDDERLMVNRSINRAFVSIGMIETARYVHNKYNVTRPIELGVSSMLGAMYNGVDVATGGGGLSPLTMEVGAALPLYTVSQTPVITPQSYPGFGGMHVNGDVILHGNVVVNANRYLGDKLTLSGTIRPADANARLIFRITELVSNMWQTSQVAVPVLDSRNAGFVTTQGLLVDGMNQTDPQGYPRGVGRKIPPSILNRDPNTGESRYVSLTRDSGVQVGGGNTGVFGHGSGIYVNNRSDRQVPENETGRQAVGSEVSLVYDWLNPNNGQPNSGWRGYLYVPPAAYVELLSDGFTIIRNTGAPEDERTWRAPDGSNTGSSMIRYRLGRGTDGRMRVVNTYTPGVSINGNLGATDFDRGPLFNGVLYFEGNVRVRGIIPTDAQITVVSNGTVYVEGSITKGVLGNQWTATYDRNVRPNDPIPTGVGERLSRLSHSMLMLMAKDYVAVNTTQFFGPAPTQPIEPVNELANSQGYTPIRVRTGEHLALQTEFVLNPNGSTANAGNPSTWRPFATEYAPQNAPSTRMAASLLLGHTMDDGPAPATFNTLHVNFGAFDTANPPQSQYYFPKTTTNLANNAPSPYATTTPIYGMGGEPYQRYGKFESILFPLIDPLSVVATDPRLMTANNDNGRYTLFSEGRNDLLLRQTNYGDIPTNDYLVGRAAIVPHDIRIEASMFAEEGSFFVIPGQWFNPNPNDRRDTYNSLGATPAERRLRRRENFGSEPGMPFYGEPADIRITVVGAVSENMPPSIDQQSEWMKKWGWIPREIGDSGQRIPVQHVPPGYDLNTTPWVPNLTIVYDPVLATARAAGFNNDPDQNPLIRTDDYGRALPPLPKLPVSPALAYFGEIR